MGNTFENRGIEHMLSFGNLLIEENFGFKMLNQYLGDLEQLKAGIPFSELGLSKRRAEGLPYVITEAADIISDPYIIRNQKLTPFGSIAVIRLIGTMQAEDGLSNYGMRTMAANMRAAYANSNIKAIILEASSGGGEMVAMQILMSVLSERNKPVIGFAQFAASAAYGAMAATDEVIADGKLAEFGSIGAMIQINKAYLEFYKENFASFYGKNAPKKNKELRAALDGDFDLIQEASDKSTDDFQAIVSALRPLSGGEVYRRETLSGNVFGAEEAKRRGLIDGIGNLQYAIKRANAWVAKYSK